MQPRLLIDIAAQRLTLLDGPRPFSAPVSTGLAGVGSQEGSGRTPLGRFVIHSLHGENAPLRTIFRGRLPVGLWPQAARGDDAILARILTLRGLDPGNANTLARYIYIHGTADTASLGRPASHGCVRLAPQAIAELFPLVRPGTPVLIVQRAGQGGRSQAG